MKSICIKTNDSNTLQYLLNELNYIEIKPVCFSSKKFKNYKNIIVHYIGTDNKTFIHELSSVLSCLVIDEEEEKFLKKILFKNYFYFNNYEKNQIIDICFDSFSDNFNDSFDKKYNCLITSFENYIYENKSIVLDGFYNFRLKNYMKLLESVIDNAVNSFIVEKEYYEFISLLKIYINSQKSSCDFVHLIYKNCNSILIDENLNLIKFSDDVFKAKYLSDISFSSNDYTLNSLLNILPKKLYIHLIDNCIDEFINTLTLIFEDRVELCNDCDICNVYKNVKKEEL